MARAREADVVGLDVSMHEAEFVDVVQRLNQLGDVKTRLRFGEPLALAKERNQVAALEELHDHVEVVIVLEAGVQLHEVVCARGQRHEALALAHQPLQIVLLRERALLHLLHRIHFARVLVLHQAHHPEPALAQRFHHREIVRLPPAHLGLQHPFFLLSHGLFEHFFLPLGHVLHVVLRLLSSILARHGAFEVRLDVEIDGFLERVQIEVGVALRFLGNDVGGTGLQLVQLSQLRLRLRGTHFVTYCFLEDCTKRTQQ
mmetsp:Transcript_23016/g.58156  ORF Transcript_23016/g.58156 Transcript_23016/m.58156 type:complete len:258 (+) Transcript_23016:1546-2319(+)